MICKFNGNPKNKSIIGTEKIMIKDSKCTITKSHQIAKENSKKVSMEKWIYKTVRKKIF